MRSLLRVCALALFVCALGCDRRIEPFDPAEQPAEPDLSKIFPAGAELAAEREAASTVALPPPPSRGAPPVSGPAGPIRGTVTLSAELADRVPPGAVLFLIARHGTSGPPVAVRRIRSPEFPLDFAIGPDDRMIEAMPFVGPLRLSARIDADANATTRSPGDLRGAAEGTFHPGAEGVSVVVDEVL